MANAGSLGYVLEIDLGDERYTAGYKGSRAEGSKETEKNEIESDSRNRDARG